LNRLVLDRSTSLDKALRSVSSSETDPVDDGPSPIKVASLFVRGRNALAVRADFAPLYVDYYLHWLDQGITQEEPYDSLLKHALAAVVLHSTTRPWRETHAWTLNFQSPLCNVFVTAGSLAESVIGRVFTHDVKQAPLGLFHAQTTVQGEHPRQSAVPLEHGQVFPAVEHFYRMSEQRRARIFEVNDEDYVMISAQPDCDIGWLNSLTTEEVRRLDQLEELSLLETRQFRFHCGCSLERIFPALAPLIANGIEDLFQGDPAISVTCPRCGTSRRLSREQLEEMQRRCAG
jgi:molecular chaperone Hsp33